jgi:beta-glucosidase
MATRDRIISPEGVAFRDLNGNGVMEPYENPTLPAGERVADLLARMTLEEKAGLMMMSILETGEAGDVVEGGGLFPDATSTLIHDKRMSHFNALRLPGPRAAARWSNLLQDMAARTRLGIPVTLYTDPRHSFSENLGAALAAGSFSLWPEPLGFGAIDDPELVERFADIARREYLAVGIRGALHPQIDLATEPRWARAAGGFGQSAETAERLVAAYLRGFQGERLTPSSVACMTKHFPGGGPQRDGEDPHFPYGREQVYPGGGFEYHLKPFRAAIAAGTAALMPYYGLPVGLTLPDGTAVEEVGFAFNRAIITALLRDQLGYDGIVCTDWGLITDAHVAGLPFPARAWGVEHLDRSDRVARVIEAGCDQFGGETCPELIVELVRTGRLAQERLDVSVRRLLLVKFELGLFDDPYVDEAAAELTVGRPEFTAAGRDAQRRSLTLLKNDGPTGLPLLPLAPGTRVYSPDVSDEELCKHGIPVPHPAEADVAILRLRAPYEARNSYFLEARFHAGSLDFDAGTLARVAELSRSIPVILDVYLDRPAILGSLADDAAAIIANYGCAEDCLLDVLFGAAAPHGRLPFELPRSMAAVEASRPDLPADTADPVYQHGFGLSYESRDLSVWLAGNQVRLVVRIGDENAIDVHPRMGLEHMHDRFAVEQVKVVQAEKEVRKFGVDVIQLRLRREPLRDVDVVSDDEALIADGAEAVIAVRGRLGNLGLHVADERVLGEPSVWHVRLVLGEDKQHLVSSLELGRDPAPDLGRPVDHAADLAARLQAAGDVIDNDVVEHAAAAAVEGAHVITRDEPEAGILHR